MPRFRRDVQPLLERSIERRAPGAAAGVKVLPLRMTAAEVEARDEAWRRLGFKSRTAMIRAAIEAYAQGDVVR